MSGGWQRVGVRPGGRSAGALVAALVAGLAAVLAVVAVVVTASGDDGDRGERGGRPVARDACGPLRDKAGGGRWSCTFVDQFDGNAVDASKWRVGDTTTTGFFTGSTCMRPGNVVVAGGRLRITARDQGAPFACRAGGRAFWTRYTGGHLATAGLFAQAYGRFEARARYPDVTTPGLHGGFWLYPEKLRYGPWPASGEIDVAEWWSNHPQTVLPTLHYPGSTPQADSGAACRVEDPSRFHTYTAEWTPEEVTFRIDGRTCFRRTWTPAAPLAHPQPLDHPFVAVLSFGVGPAAGPNAVSPATTLPASYEVDYVKVWR